MLTGQAQAVPRAREAGVVSLEFAIIAPVLLAMVMGAFDIARAVIYWQETQTAAQNIALGAASYAANSASTSAGNNNTSNLTPAQATEAMSILYGVIPIAKTTTYTGAYSVTLSFVEYANGNQAYVIWSVPLLEGTSQRVTAVRACGLTAQTATYPETSATMSSVPTSGLNVESPILVADVHFKYIPTFYRFVGNMDFWETYITPPLSGLATGPTTQVVTYDNNSSSNGYVCQGQPPTSS